MSRRFAREEAFKILYQIDIHKGEEEAILELYFELHDINESVKDYIKDVVNGTMDNIETINKYIKENSIKWDLNRISKVNAAILRLATYEMIYRNDIPINVSINEAVELTKKFDSEKASSFVNGILGSIQKKIKFRSE